MMSKIRIFGARSSCQFGVYKRFNSTKTRREGPIRFNGDLIGPPNPISNIRPITFHIPKNETNTEKQLRITRQKVQSWHEDFWSKHNAAFIQEKKEFQKSRGDERALLESDEMSMFYKQFLDKYWEKHLSYNYQWYKLNFSLLMLSFKVEIERYISKALNR